MRRKEIPLLLSHMSERELILLPEDMRDAARKIPNYTNGDVI